MTISKDHLAAFDPCIKKVTVKDGYINLQLEPNSSVVTLSELELHLLTKELQETRDGI